MEKWAPGASVPPALIRDHPPGAQLGVLLRHGHFVLYVTACPWKENV